MPATTMDIGLAVLASEDDGVVMAVLGAVAVGAVAVGVIQVENAGKRLCGPSYYVRWSPRERPEWMPSGRSGKNSIGLDPESLAQLSQDELTALYSELLSLEHRAVDDFADAKLVPRLLWKDMVKQKHDELAEARYLVDANLADRFGPSTDPYPAEYLGEGPESPEAGAKRVAQSRYNQRMRERLGLDD